MQLTPLALYNFLLFDQLRDLPPADEYDPEDPPESVVILSLGTDATDLVVTNGYRVWQRSIPLGGNHFTKALTKELKLTFAKAEHLKRNAAAAQDPKAVFQAMRPVFNDLLTEVQRSIGYFSSIDRAAKIERIVALGNAMKLPGLRRYLSQSLGYEIGSTRRIPRTGRLRGGHRAGLQGERPVLRRVLRPGLAGAGQVGRCAPTCCRKEIVKDRLIRQKKPWAVAAAATMLLACSISFATFSRAEQRRPGPVAVCRKPVQPGCQPGVRVSGQGGRGQGAVRHHRQDRLHAGRQRGRADLVARDAPRPEQMPAERSARQAARGHCRTK